MGQKKWILGTVWILSTLIVIGLLFFWKFDKPVQENKNDNIENTPPIPQESVYVIGGIKNASSSFPELTKHVKEAYLELGIEIQIEEMPALRSLEMANVGSVDAELFRTEEVAKSYPDLIKVDVPIGSIASYIYVKDPDMKIEGLSSLKNYTVAYPRGYILAKEKLDQEGIEAVAVDDTVMALKMLEANRIDAALLLGIEAEQTIEKMDLNEIVRVGEPISTSPLFHFINKKHKDLISRLEEAFKKMESIDY